MMDIKFGYEIHFTCTQRTPMLLMLHSHPSRGADLITPDDMFTDPVLPLKIHRDAFGNRCTRLVAPRGQLLVMARGVMRDTGAAEPEHPAAREHAVESLPEDTLVYLLPSRHCETEFLMGPAWNLFGDTPPGWQRVQAICDFVHRTITHGIEHARATRTAWEVFQERRGVCRDFAHLAIALCRCLNIPARFCTGYPGGIGAQSGGEPQDFSSWFEAYLGGAWHSFDPRHNQRRIGRILIGRGRDAADVAVCTSFGPSLMDRLHVWVTQARGDRQPVPAQLGPLSRYA